MQTKPFSLSVVVPTHGGRASLVDTVRALLADPSPELEVIVVSDGDPSAARQTLIAVEDSRLRIIAQEKQGSAAARNLGLANARYEWVAFVDDDDLPRPNWFAFWAANVQEGDIVLTACVKHWIGHVVAKEQRCCSLDESDPTMGASRLLAGAFIVRKAALRAVGGYDRTLKASQNQDLGLRLLDHIQREGHLACIRNTSDIVIEVFTEPAASRQHRYGTSRADAAKVFQQRFKARLSEDPSHAASLHRIIARSALAQGDGAEFRRSAIKAFLARPTERANLKFFLAALLPSSIVALALRRSSHFRCAG